MGALYTGIVLTNDNGNMQSRIQEAGIYIWRDEVKLNDGDVLNYYASRTPPAEITYDYEDMITFGGEPTTHKHPHQPIVEFKHKYSDGAELCVARAILALAERGLNV